jgi:hypothetical protein
MLVHMGLLALQELFAALSIFAFVSVAHAAYTPSPFTQYKIATTTLFWVGEGADSSNNFISNVPSYWDEEWQTHFGGVDSPASRCGYRPCSFVPKENPFYVALPYGEIDPQTGELKPSARGIPWFGEEPLLKNRWVEVLYAYKVCYGQLEDVGPNETDDYGYVFGGKQIPQNTFGEHAGLDISPALWECLGLRDNAPVAWRFVREESVPAGPWRETITRSGVYWK